MSPLEVLIETVDRVLVDHGNDPTLVSEADKIALATQYVEIGGIQEKIQGTAI